VLGALPHSEPIVRHGSEADEAILRGYVRFTPESEHSIDARPLRAMSRHAWADLPDRRPRAARR